MCDHVREVLSDLPSLVITNYLGYDYKYRLSFCTKCGEHYIEFTLARLGWEVMHGDADPIAQMARGAIATLLMLYASDSTKRNAEL